MTKKVIAAIAAAALASCIVQAAAADLASPPQRSFVPRAEAAGSAWRRAGYSPLCGYGAHYACWYGADGGRYCGCWLGGDRPACPYGYHFSCRYGPDGPIDCACY